LAEKPQIDDFIATVAKVKLDEAIDPSLDEEQRKRMRLRRLR